MVDWSLPGTVHVLVAVIPAPGDAHWAALHDMVTRAPEQVLNSLNTFFFTLRGVHQIPHIA